MTKPIKRHPFLKPVSRDHHHALLLCWKIRTGFALGIETSRIKDYADWFFHHHLLAHFEIEEKYIFPPLGEGHPHIKKALAEHRRLTRLFGDDDDPTRSLSLIEEELDQHIRFEERVIFNELQQVASEQELKKIEEAHRKIGSPDDWPDEFWVR